MTIIPFTNASPRPYPHLHRRVVNIYTGILGTITAAEPRQQVKRGWDLTIKWDDGHENGCWTDRDISRNGNTKNRLVADDYIPNYGPFLPRVQALIDRIDKGDVRWVRGYSVEGRCGHDYIHIWKPLAHRKFETMANLFGGQGTWKASGSTEEEAWSNLRQVLTSAMETLAQAQGAPSTP